MDGAHLCPFSGPRSEAPVLSGGSLKQMNAGPRVRIGFHFSCGGAPDIGLFCPTWDQLIRVGRSLGHRWGFSRQLSCSPTHCGRWILRGHRAAPRVGASVSSPSSARATSRPPPWTLHEAPCRGPVVPRTHAPLRAEGRWRVSPRVSASPPAARGPLPALGPPLVLARVRVAYARKALPSAPRLGYNPHSP